MGTRAPAELSCQALNRLWPVRAMSLRDEDSLRETVTPHSPQPTAVLEKAAARAPAAGVR
jgi:hypothetical protein